MNLIKDILKLKWKPVAKQPDDDRDKLMRELFKEQENWSTGYGDVTKLRYVRRGDR